MTDREWSAFRRYWRRTRSPVAGSNSHPWRAQTRRPASTNPSDSRPPSCGQWSGRANTRPSSVRQTATSRPSCCAAITCPRGQRAIASASRGRSTGRSQSSPRRSHAIARKLGSQSTLANLAPRSDVDAALDVAALDRRAAAAATAAAAVLAAAAVAGERDGVRDVLERGVATAGDERLLGRIHLGEGGAADRTDDLRLDLLDHHRARLGQVELLRGAGALVDVGVDVRADAAAV